MRRNIVSDMSAKCQYFVRSVLNHDFVDDLLMSREESREVNSRPSCALTTHVTAMQNIIIPIEESVVSINYEVRPEVRREVRCEVSRLEL